MSWRLPIPMTSLLLLSFLLVLWGPALEGYRSASVGDTSGAKPPENAEEHESNRVYKEAGKLSEKEHGHFHEYDDVHDVGDGDHGEKRDENYEYDHEAFLGAEDAHEFDDLDPEESKRRLVMITEKIDHDSNGFVTLEEMKNWIRFIHDRQMSKDIEEQWVKLNKEGKDAIDWGEYRQIEYRVLEDLHNDEKEDMSEEDRDIYRKLEERDRQRWNLTDEDADGFLSKYEFKHFLHPEEYEKTKYIVVKETIEDMDKDGDGKISLNEYVDDMTAHVNEKVRVTGENATEKVPEWIAKERYTFTNDRDKNQDGFLDAEEIKEWILPNEFDHIYLEAEYLIKESDSNSDKMLTKDEIIAKQDLFVGSTATDFGMALLKSWHDEL